MSNQGYGRNPYWAPEYTGQKPSFNDMGAMRLNPDNPLNQGLVAWWLMNEGGGAQVVDIVKSSKAILVGGASWGNFSYGRGLSFDGVDGKLSVPQIYFDRTEQKTACFTVRFATAVDGVCLGVVSPWYYPYIDATNLYFRDVDGPVSLAHGGLSVGIPYKIIASDNGTNITVYVNGVLKGTTVSKALTLTSVASFSDSTSNNVDGQIDNVMVYSRALPFENAISISNSPYGTPANPRFIVMPQRTWFVPSGGGATTHDLAFAGASSPSSVAAIAISAIREIALSSASSSSSIVNLALEVIHALSLENVAASSQVINLALSAIRQIVSTSVSSNSTVADIEMSVIRELGLVGISAGSSVGTLALSIIHELDFSDVAATTQVVDVVLSIVAGAISLTELSVMSESQVTSLVMTKTAELGITDASVVSQVVSIILAVIRELPALIDAASASSIGTVTLQIIKNLTQSSLSSASSVGNIILLAIRRLDELGASAATEVVNILITVLHQLGINDLSISTTVTHVALTLINYFIACTKIFVSPINVSLSFDSLIIKEITQNSPINKEFIFDERDVCW